MKFIIFTLLCIFGFSAYAQVDMEAGGALLKPVLEILATYLPENVLAIVTLIGSFRLVLKPIMVLFESIAEASGKEELKLKYDEVNEGNTYKTVRFILDYVASIKLPVKK